MKKILTSIVALLFVGSIMSFTPAVEKPTKEKDPFLNAKNILVPIGKTGKKISLFELSTISKPELEKLTGKKMNFAQRLAFKGTQRKLQKGMNADGVITNKKLQKAFGAKGDGGGFHLGGFALGFLLGLIGVLIAYVAFNDDLKSSRVKWAWLGLAAAVVISLILVLAVFSSVT